MNARRATLSEAPTLPKASDCERNRKLRKASGNVTLPAHNILASFLYTLLRDGTPIGEAERAIRDVEDQIKNHPNEDVTYTNGWLARYCEHLEERLCAVQHEAARQRHLAVCPACQSEPPLPESVRALQEKTWENSVPIKELDRQRTRILKWLKRNPDRKLYTLKEVEDQFKDTEFRQDQQGLATLQLLQELQRGGHLKLRGNVTCGNGHVLFEDDLDVAKERQFEQVCEMCEPLDEPDIEDNFLTVFVVLP